MKIKKIIELQILSEQKNKDLGWESDKLKEPLRYSSLEIDKAIIDEIINIWQDETDITPKEAHELISSGVGLFCDEDGNWDMLVGMIKKFIDTYGVDHIKEAWIKLFGDWNIKDDREDILDGISRYSSKTEELEKDLDGKIKEIIIEYAYDDYKGKIKIEEEGWDSPILSFLFDKYYEDKNKEINKWKEKGVSAIEAFKILNKEIVIDDPESNRFFIPIEKIKELEEEFSLDNIINTHHKLGSPLYSSVEEFEKKLREELTKPIPKKERIKPIEIIIKKKIENLHDKLDKETSTEEKNKIKEEIKEKIEKLRTQAQEEREEKKETEKTIKAGKLLASNFSPKEILEEFEELIKSIDLEDRTEVKEEIKEKIKTTLSQNKDFSLRKLCDKIEEDIRKKYDFSASEEYRTDFEENPDDFVEKKIKEDDPEFEPLGEYYGEEDYDEYDYFMQKFEESFLQSNKVLEEDIPGYKPIKRITDEEIIDKISKEVKE